MTNDPRILADVVVHLCEIDDWHELGHVRAISVDKVLAWSWRPDRLQDCAERLAAGERAPAIHVGRYWLPGLRAVYTVSDGHHRTIAARQAGRKTIRAHVAGENWCRPQNYLLDGKGILWRKDGDRLTMSSVGAVSDELQQALTEAGVRRF